jgi:hypothetical protein
MSALPSLTRVLINLTRGNSKIWGVVNLPKGSATGSLDFSPVAKMLLTRRGSVAEPGDTVLDLGERYVLGYFSAGVNDSLFRMFRTPHTATVTRMLTGKDPVTQLERSGRPTPLGLCSFDRTNLGMTGDFGAHKRVSYRIITGFPLEINDMLDDLKITNVRSEQGVVIAEAE